MRTFLPHAANEGVLAGQSLCQVGSADCPGSRPHPGLAHSMTAQPLGVVSGGGSLSTSPTLLFDTPDREFDSH